jgi:hypothetical protein
MTAQRKSVYCATQYEIVPMNGISTEGHEIVTEEAHNTWTHSIKK